MVGLDQGESRIGATLLVPIQSLTIKSYPTLQHSAHALLTLHNLPNTHRGSPIHFLCILTLHSPLHTRPIHFIGTLTLHSPLHTRPIHFICTLTLHSPLHILLNIYASESPAYFTHTLINTFHTVPQEQFTNAKSFYYLTICALAQAYFIV